MFNCRTLIFSFTPIEIVPQRDLRWWTRQILPFIQFSPFSNLSALTNAICWKCSLKNNCVRSCLIKLQSFFDDSMININPEYRILMPFPSVLHVSCMTRYRSSRYALDLCGLLFLDQQARRTQIVFCSNFDLQVSIHC